MRNPKLLKIDDVPAATLSIIIPTYQAGGTLENALSSIASQTSQCDEVLIMDGGSSDETAAIAKRFHEQFPQIQFYSEPDEGVYDAMNKGIRMARGDWLFFMGSDDILYHQETLQRVLPALSSDVDVVYGNVFSTRFDGIYDGEFDSEKIVNKNISHQAIFFHRRVFEAVGVYDLDYKIVADWELNFRWFLSAQIRRKHIDEVICNYADGGMSSRHDDPLFQQNRMLLYLRHGKDQLSFRVKTLILLREFKRGLRTLNPQLLGGVLRTATRVYF